MNYPYSEQDMVYDFQSHRYVLTPDCVNRELGLNLNVDGKTDTSTNPSNYANQLLKRISRMVYNYIYEAVMDTEYCSFLLAKTPSCRNKLKEMMLAQTEYVALGGYSPLMSGINPGTGQVTDINALRGRVKVADEVEQIAHQIVKEWGVCMRYMGSLPCIYGLDEGEW